MDCSTPGFPVLRYLPEFAQTHVGFLRSLWTREEGASQKEWLSPSPVCPQGDQACLFFLNQSSLGPGLLPKAWWHHPCWGSGRAFSRVCHLWLLCLVLRSPLRSQWTQTMVVHGDFSLTNRHSVEQIVALRLVSSFRVSYLYFALIDFP